MERCWVRHSFLLAAVGVLMHLSGEGLRAQSPAASATAKQPHKPNIILILADDLGYGDLGCYGQSWIRTPHIDRLAGEGIRFLNHYAGSPIGAPSRCCLLTGKHTGHVPVRGNVAVQMAPDDLTVAQMLKNAGYATGLIGKWAVGDPPSPGDPNRRGFDEFFGFLDRWHAHNYYPDYLWKNESKCAIKGNVVKVIGRGGVAIKRTQYVQDLLTEAALSFIEANRGKPFFLYLAFTIPHANNEAGTRGMEVPNDIPYSEMDWPKPQKNQAAMITRLDYSVGRIAESLTKLGLAGQTLVLFSSDNGPHKEGGADPLFFRSSGSLRGYKRDLHEGGIRVPLVASWPKSIPPGTVTSHASALWDFLPTAAEIAGAPAPKGIDGISYLPTLLGQTERQKQHEYLYWEFHEHGPVQAVRIGDWKAVAVVGGGVELYDLKKDASEHENVAAAHADVVDQVKRILKSARVESPLFPLKPVAKPKPAS